MNNNCPKISVVMTVYNAARYVRAAIDSILIQTFTEFEFIIVDNCSSDRTVEIIESYGDKRIILIKNNENVGQTKALNIGLQESMGNYIARMDADDVCVPERLQLQYDFLEEHPEIAVVGSSWIYINDEGRELRTYHTLTD
ncbi:MAG: glycosyltransferase family 2 protein, partial [Candidatus Omnitrophica bacterium]|nr:glycosyltransferase family 2 protein [Candidatus Omnitrophota bacterium]